MAIFSRRILQQLINENTQVLPRKQIRKHVGELNRMHSTLTLAAEWEVVLLNAFSKLGKIVHESGPAGTSDLYFEAHDEPKQTFVADITAVSDKGFELRHSFDVLQDELTRRVVERGFNPNHFHLEVQGNARDVQRGRYYRERSDDSNTLLYKGGVKAELYMPGPAKFAEKIFNQEWERFLDELRSSPPYNVYRVYKPQERINIAITFRHQRFGSSSHLAYKQINHLTQNRVYESLEEGCGQLVKAKFNGCLGIIVCDGGYSPFHETPHFSTHPVREVVSYFLKNNSSVGFVLTLLIKGRSLYGSLNEIVAKTYVNGSMSQKDEPVLGILDRIVEFLPQPESDAFNALNHLRGGSPQEGRQNGELTLSSKEIKISARALMELLSGRVTHEQFTKSYDIIPPGSRTPGYTNFFDMRLKAGMLISDVTIERSDTKDDDVITIRLAGPDPAISRFVVPD